MSEGSGLLGRLSDELAGAVETAGRSVVRVNARRRMPASGLIWSADGAIVTADHILEREEDVTVGLEDGKEIGADVVGRDPTTDLAVLRLKGGASGLTAIRPAESFKVGSLVLAVGRPGSAASATLGVIASIGQSARTSRGGQLDGFVRTDAVLLPGFSGGALVDVSGGAVGLTTSHFGQGTGFAIRMGTVQRVAEQLLQGGRVKRGYLGVSSQPVPLPAGLKEKYTLEQETALLLVGVEPNGPADRGGLLMGDLLVGLGGDPIKDTDDLQWALRSERVGQSVQARVVRGGDLREIALEVGERQT
ncbi:MAG TPA: trypsin-like peptidase domain-containing protein [Chloroflexota bacterium]|jgi:S1-C subfamily serine protease